MRRTVVATAVWRICTGIRKLCSTGGRQMADSVAGAGGCITSQQELDAIPDDDSLRCQRVRAISAASVVVPVLHQRDGLLAVDKPADLRMNGAFDLTLQRLIEERIAPEDRSLRYSPCHQLDFATSGVLLYAGNERVAQKAQVLFEKRQTRKQYLALVHGHLLRTPLMPGVMQLSVDAGISLEQAAAELERPAVRKNAFVTKSAAISPPRAAGHWYEQLQKHLASSAAPWRHPGARAVSTLSWKAFRALATSQRAASGAAAPPVVGELVRAMEAGGGAGGPVDAREAILMGAVDILGGAGTNEVGDDFGAARSTEDGPTTGQAAAAGDSDSGWAARLFDACVRCEAIDTRRYREQQAAASAPSRHDLSAAATAAAAAAQGASQRIVEPAIEAATLCGLAEKSAGAAAAAAAATRPMFLVDLPLADIPGDFRMCVGSSSADGGSSSSSSAVAPRGRPAQTLVQVLAHGWWRAPPHPAAATGGDVSSPLEAAAATPVTKLLLRPITGRRHQLRVHLAACGYPIVGDVTYCGDDAKPRMMLHAWRLQLLFAPPPPPQQQKQKQQPSRLAKQTAPDGPPEIHAANAASEVVTAPGDGAAVVGADAAAARPGAAAAPGGKCGFWLPSAIQPPAGPVTVCSADPFRPAAAAMEGCLALDGPGAHDAAEVVPALSLL